MNPRRLLFLLLILPVASPAQQLFENFSEMRGRKATGKKAYAVVRYGLTPGDAMGGIFLWDSLATTADNSLTSIGNWTPGRWVKVEPLGQKRGLSTFNYTTGQLTYTFNHGLSQTPANVQYSIKSAVIPGPSSWSATATSISITFNTLPVFIGTTPFSVAWVAYLN